MHCCCFAACYRSCWYDTMPHAQLLALLSMTDVSLQHIIQALLVGTSKDKLTTHALYLSGYSIMVYQGKCCQHSQLVEE